MSAWGVSTGGFPCPFCAWEIANAPAGQGDEHARTGSVVDGELQAYKAAERRDTAQHPGLP